MKFKHTAIAAVLMSTAGLAGAAEIPVDLGGWSRLGPAANGNWVVAPGGTSVTQTINDDPTFFVGPDSYIDSVLRGKIRVGTSSDNDFVGFVMGYNAPAGTGSDMDYVLLDWKQGDQNNGGFLALEGFALSRVNGTINSSGYLSSFWGHTESAAFDVLGTNHGAAMGWDDNVEYSFEISYRSDRVTVDVSGGAFATPTTVLDVTGSFPEGRFGFYNYSQANVTYSGFTLEQLPPPPPPPPTGVPEPGSAALALAGLAGMVGLSRRRRRLA